MVVRVIQQSMNIKQFNFLYCIFAWLILSGNTIVAQELTATSSSTSVSVGEQIQITFTVNATGKNFRAPSFPDFNVLTGPNQSTQMQIINGSVSQSISFTYVLQAVKEGSFKIGSAEISVNNNKLTSNPLTIVVSKAGNKQSAQGGDNSSGVAGGKNVFIRAQADKNSAYMGEGIAVTYKLYTRVTLLNYSVSKLPSFNGFWSQEIPMAQQLEFHNENVDGVQFSVADIKKLIVFPQRSGSLSLDPMEGEVIARVQVKRQQQNSNDPFGQLFNDPFFNNPFFNNNVQDVKVAVKSDPLKINVKELPAGQPAGFTGAVGKFAYEVSLDKNKTTAHDAVTLKVKISGKGNIKLIDPPKIDFPPDFETYDPKENVSSNPTLNGVTGSKTFEYLIIPRNPGNFKIDIAPFSYFDLEKKQFVELSSPDLSLNVSRGSETGTTVVSGVNKTDVQMLGKDIRFIKTRDPEFVKGKNNLFGSPVFYSLIAAPVLLFAGLIFIRRRKENMMGNMNLVRSQRANKVAMKRLSAAKKYLTTNEKDKFLDEMFRALWGFISDKLQIPIFDLSKETATAALIKKNVAENLVAQFSETVDSCEFARFGGGMAESNEMIYKKGIEVITELENAIRS